MIKARLIPVMMLSLLATNANAEFYIGLGIGSADLDVDLTPVGGGNFEESSTSTKYYAGYSFNEYLAVEGAYYNFAEASVGALETTPGSGIFVSASADMSGPAVLLNASYPVDKNVLLFARAGMIDWEADISLNNNNVSNDGTDAVLGFGAAYGLSKEFFVHAEWETIDSDNPEVSMLSLGASWRFK